MKTESFVVTVAGATDIYRREQILSQQSQKIDQHIFEVYDNLENQTEKIQEMSNNLKGERDHKDWDLGDVENLDDHLWANLKVALKDIFESGKFRGETLSATLVQPGAATRQRRMDEFTFQVIKKSKYLYLLHAKDVIDFYL